MSNGKNINTSKNFWEAVIDFDLYKACIELESKLKENQALMLGKVNPNPKSVYISDRCVSVDIFTHDHLYLYQQLNAQLIRLGKAITTLNQPSTPTDTLIALEKEYQALSLYIQRKEFLDVYENRQNEFESCRVEMVEWYNNLVRDNIDDYEDYQHRLDNIRIIQKKAADQRNSLITILYQTKEEYEQYLFSRYKKKSVINQKWQTYFGNLLWHLDGKEICDIQGRPLSSYQLWKKIGTIFLLSKRSLFSKDSPVKDMLHKHIQRQKSDAGIEYRNESKTFELVKDYSVQLEIISKVHFSAIQQVKRQRKLEGVIDKLSTYQKKARILVRQTKQDEALLIGLITSRIDNLIQNAENKLLSRDSKTKPPTLIASSLLTHQIRYYQEIISYIHGILTSLGYDKHQKHSKLIGSSQKTSFFLKQLYDLVETHKHNLVLIESNPYTLIKSYPIHLEKMAFFEALSNYNQQFGHPVTKNSSLRFFTGNNEADQFLELCNQLTDTKLYVIDEAVQKLRTMYREIYRKIRPVDHEPRKDTQYSNL